MNQKNELNRREFLVSAGSLSFFGLYPISDWDVREPESVPVLKAGPYLQSLKQEEISIRWITNVPCYSWVEYGNKPDKIIQKAESTSNGLIDAYQTVHKITLKGLLSGQNYYYRIYSRVIDKFEPYNVVFEEQYASPVYSFATISEQMENISFLVFNDIHDHPESFVHLLKFQYLGKKDFVLLNGDMFNYMTNENQIVQNLLEPLSGLSSEVPIVFSRGNHETRGKFARHLSSYFNNSEKDFYFSFIAGPLYCIVLDSGEDKQDNDSEYFGLVKFDQYRMEQKEWLKKEILKEAFKKAKYRIVFSHIPPFYSGDGHGTLHCRKLWSDIFNQANIDLLIAGHTHVYGIHPPIEGQHNYPIVIGGGPKNGIRTIIEVKADSTNLHLRLTGDDGTERGTLTI